MPNGLHEAAPASGVSAADSLKLLKSLPAKLRAELDGGSWLESPEDVLLHDVSFLSRRLRVSESEAANVIRSISRSILEPGPGTASQLKARLRYLSTGDKELDKFLKGGIPAAGITEIYGESGTGKTQFCLQLCLTVQRPLDQGGLDGGAVFLATSPFPARRFEELSSFLTSNGNGSLPPTAETCPGSKVFIAHLGDLETQEHVIQYQLPVLLRNNNVKLVVLDSVAANFRSMQEHGDSGSAVGGNRYYLDRARNIFLLAQRLNVLSARHGAVVVCVNQVTAALGSADAEESDDSDARKRTRSPDAGFGSQKLNPALGMLWSSTVATRIQLLRRERFCIPRLERAECPNGQRMEDGYEESKRPSFATARSTTERQLRVVRSPYLPPKSCSISIGPSGVRYA